MKPDNLLLRHSSSGPVVGVVSDLGLTRLVGVSTRGIAHRDFCPPFADVTHPTPKQDVYSFGLTILCMLCRVLLPTEVSGGAAAMARHVEQQMGEPEIAAMCLGLRFSHCLRGAATFRFPHLMTKGVNDDTCSRQRPRLQARQSVREHNRLQRRNRHADRSPDYVHRRRDVLRVISASTFKSSTWTFALAPKATPRTPPTGTFQ